MDGMPHVSSNLLDYPSLFVGGELIIGILKMAEIGFLLKLSSDMM